MTDTVFRRRPEFRVRQSPIFLLLAVASATSGTAALTLDSVGALTGSGALAGVAAMSLGATGPLSAPGDASGVAAQSFGLTADLTGLGQLAGASTLTLDASASAVFTNNYQFMSWTKPRRWYNGYPFNYATNANRLVFFPTTAPIGITGAASIDFGGSGVLVGVSAASGISALQFGGQAAIVAGGGLAGNAVFTFTPSAVISGTASGSITGQTSLLLNPTGGLLGAGRLIGQSLLSFTPTGSIGQVAQRDAFSDLSFTLSGTLGDGTVVDVEKILFRMRTSSITFRIV